MKTILCKEGYLIPKNNEYNNIINNIKNELKVKPFSPYNFSFIKKQDTSIIIYKEIVLNKKELEELLEIKLDNNEYHFLVVPKYYGLNKIGKPFINKENIGINIDISFSGLLREKQNNIVDNIIPYINKNDGGVLCLPCAAGKTVLSLFLISYFKVKTLVIVHKTFLLKQWKDRAKEFTNAKVGIR